MLAADSNRGFDRGPLLEHRPDRGHATLALFQRLRDNSRIDASAVDRDVHPYLGEDRRVLVSPLATHVHFQPGDRLPHPPKSHGHRPANAAGKARQQHLQRPHARRLRAGLKRVVHRGRVLLGVHRETHPAFVRGVHS